MRLHQIPIVFVLSLLASSLGCQTADQSLGRAPLGKADAFGSCEADDGTLFCGGQSDGNCWCDAQCQSFGDCCSDMPVVCDEENTGYDPCGELTCGDECSLCPPDDPDCFETAVLKFCQADGSCEATVPACEAFDPCSGLQCGDLCSTCPPNDPDCVETAEVKVCQADGSCSGAAPQCDSGGGFDPCAGLTCGDSCTLCDPADPDCVETAVPKLCQPDGSCAAVVPSC